MGRLAQLNVAEDLDARREARIFAWRCTVLEFEVSEAAKRAFVEKFAFFHKKEIQILLYTNPGHNGSLEIGKRLIKWVWYCNYPQDSKEYPDLMTDTDGHRHHITLLNGNMRPEI